MDVVIYSNLYEMPIEDMLDYEFMFDCYNRLDNIIEYSMRDYDNDIEIEIRCDEEVFYSFQTLRELLTFHGIKFMSISFYDVIDEERKDIVKEYRYIPGKFEFFIGFN